MARTENDLTAVMITQDFLPDHWDLSDPEKLIIATKDITAVGKLLMARLTQNNFKISECYAVRHDRDTHMAWDETLKQNVISYKTDHIHIVVKFSKGGTLSAIAKAVGLEPQFIEKPSKGRYAYDNMLSYLIHIKHTDKAQYYDENGTEVITLAGKNYNSVYHERKEEWLKGRAKVQSQKAKVDIDWLESKILLGEVTKSQVLLTDEYYNIYAHNKRRCEDAFDTYGQHKIYKTIQKMENGEFKLSVIFVTGRSHSGKSIFTDKLVESIQRQALEKLNEQWSVCSVASSNPFDDFNGEEILVMDDLRGVSLSASDWLKLLDPDRINIGSARYRNKKMACRTIIINSEKDVLDFFYYLKNSGGGDRSEALDQFFRRIMAKVIVYRLPDSDERRVAIGEMHEVDEYEYDVKNSTGTRTLKLHHDFIPPRVLSADGKMSKTDIMGYMNYSDALEYLTNMIMSRNSVPVQPLPTDNNTAFAPRGMCYNNDNDYSYTGLSVEQLNAIKNDNERNDKNGTEEN